MRVCALSGGPFEVRKWLLHIEMNSFMDYISDIKLLLLVAGVVQDIRNENDAQFSSQWRWNTFIFFLSMANTSQQRIKYTHILSKQTLVLVQHNIV